jgi:hypothetical protein
MDNENTNISDDGSDPLLGKALMILAIGKVKSVTLMSDGDEHSALIRISHLPATPRSGSSE